MNRRLTSFAWVLALVAVLPCFLMPLYNPDIFWHLSAASRMMATHSIPRADWLSFTRAGTSWIDFEWGSEVLFGIAYMVAGMKGLFLLKITVLALAAGVFLATLRLYQVPSLYAAAGLAAWATAIFSRSDIRPELFSVLLFSLLFLFLESRRSAVSGVQAWWMVPLFGIWANLHAGYAYGLVLISFYVAQDYLDGVGAFSGSSAGESRRERTMWIFLACALAGTLLQPFGVNAYRILWRHWRDMDTLSTQLFEWQSAQLYNPWHWPFWILLFAGCGAALLNFWRNRKISFAHLAALLFFGFSASQHVRHEAFFAPIAIPLTVFWISQNITESRVPVAGAGSMGIIILSAVYLFWSARDFELFRTAFHPRFVPLQTAEFLALEKDALGHKPLYHKWGWGGYLGWRLNPNFLVFEDGRYVFHGLLNEGAEATRTPETWQAFLDRYNIQTTLLENVPWRLSTTRLYPGGSSATFLRPYYVLYMPRERWALVHWDDQALVFVRRAGMSQEWLTSHEFRYARPFDDDARRDALLRKEIPAAAVDREVKRHNEEVKVLVSRADRIE